ncbi:MAG: hypothetical protein CL583_06915 [Alteromonadaceae bacterium]|nr:hypothetical protein [Alteromonadaceae bacterium]
MSDILDSFFDLHPNLPGLAVALLLGLLIGTQRGWTQRERSPGERVAGVRTHTLTGLLGGLTLVLAESLGHWFAAVMLISFTLLVVTSYHAKVKKDQNVGITGSISLFLTFIFGTLAVEGETFLAASAAVTTALILDNKQEIHRWVGLLQEKELAAGLKLLLISVVMLPVLPNEGFGPGDALNPYEIWWMVVLIASISFVGYFAMRIGGTRKGTVFTGLFAGLSSSTALTLHYARLSRQAGENASLLATGILLACGTMGPRVLLITAIVYPPLAFALLPPLSAAVLVMYLLAWRLWLKSKDAPADAGGGIGLQNNPLDLKSALVMGTIVAVVLALSEIFRERMGDTGIYLLAAVTGIADVNPITLSSARMAGAGLGLQAAAYSILIAAGVNSLIKVAAAAIIGRDLGRYLLAPICLAVVVGAVTALLLAGAT